MVRTLIVCAVLTVWAPVCLAQNPPKETETVIRLTVQPMTAPKPALKYQLLPELKEMMPGNPILGYLKCFMEQQNFFHNKEVIAEREKWTSAPLADLPLKQLHDYGGGALRRADEAARLDAPDWQILLKAKKEGIRLLLPEVQELRNLAWCLQLRFRVQVAEGDFDHAIVTAKTMLALSRHMAEHPTLISDLVGIAIAQLAMRPLEEMLEQPGCPNLYWALTDLPHPFIDLRKGLQGERLLTEPIFGFLDESEPMSEERLQNAVTEVDLALKAMDAKEDARAWLDARVKDDNLVQTARKRLIDSGMAEKKVQQFPPLQVVLLDEKLEFEVRRDEQTKWLSLPFWKAEAGFLEAVAAHPKNDRLLSGFHSSLIKVKRAQTRIEQRIALLRHVEALRMYAADHDGKLPAKLDDVKVPLPEDPFTGKAFGYEVSGATALLKGSAPKGEEANPAYNIRYAVTIKK
jgi:hypothetical protein